MKRSLPGASLGRQRGWFSSSQNNEGFGRRHKGRPLDFDYWLRSDGFRRSLGRSRRRPGTPWPASRNPWPPFRAGAGAVEAEGAGLPQGLTTGRFHSHGRRAAHEVGIAADHVDDAVGVVDFVQGHIGMIRDVVGPAGNCGQETGARGILSPFPAIPPLLLLLLPLRPLRLLTSTDQPLPVRTDRQI